MVKFKCENCKVHMQIDGTPDDIMIDVFCCLTALDVELKKAGAYAESTAIKHMVKKWAEGEPDDHSEE